MKLLYQFAGACLRSRIWVALFAFAADAQEIPVTVQSNVTIPMADGTALSANVFLPERAGTFPTILVRTPYGKGDETHREGLGYARLGYAFVIQDCRGTGDSEGDWDPFKYDTEDGLETLEWIGAQAWNDGQVATSGGSYVGWTQWAMATGKSDLLKTMVPVVPFSNAYDIAYDGGAFQLALLMTWGAATGGAAIAPGTLSEAYRYLPMNRWGEQLNVEVPYLADWVEHPTFDAYWEDRGIGRDNYDRVTIPILNIGGWYDIFSKATVEMIAATRERSKNRLVRRNQFVLMGPWTHGVGGRQVGELDFGAEASREIGEITREWFDYWLKGQESGIQDWPAYQIFVMGENRWRGENEWPLERTEFTPFYFGSNNGANSLNGDGTLGTRGIEDVGSDRFIYDPEDPVPTAGGANLAGAPAGPFDQSDVERREDVLVYTSAPLESPVEVTGPVKVVLYASSSAKDTDFTAKLVDVHPDGRAMNLCDGIARARWRNSRETPELMEPGKVYAFEIDLWVTSNVFFEGHRMRVEISSSNFPRFDRNLNTGEPASSAVEMIRAEQTVYHGGDRPSHILLPVIPR